jgi:antitoxin component of MazEF toxin-antitoxin module
MLYLFIWKTIKEVYMKMVFETKVGNIGGSATVVIPAGLVKLLHIDKGDKIIWDVELDAEGATVTVSSKKE